MNNLRCVALTGLIAAALAQVAARAETMTVAVPGQGWGISMDAPVLKMFRGQSKGDSFQYIASGDGGFNLSIFVETPPAAGKTHQDCYEHYWPLAKRNPMIDQESVKMSKAEGFVKVTYLIKPEGQDKVSRNVNYFFAFKDRWIDVHVSIFPSGEGDSKVLDAFEKSLKYAVAEPSKKP